MTKFYTMKECFDACGDDDVPFIEMGYNDLPKKHRETKRALSEYNSLGLSAKEIFSDRWQIKRAELRVLKPFEYLEKEHGILAYCSNPPNEFDYRQVEKAFINGDKNGQLREWFRLKPVIDAMVDYMHQNDHRRTVADVKTMLKNLKPPQ